MELLGLRIAPERLQLMRRQPEGSISKLVLFLAGGPHDDRSTRDRLQLGWSEKRYAVSLPKWICQCYSAPLAEIVFGRGIRINAKTPAVLPDSTCLTLQTQLHAQ